MRIFLLLSLCSAASSYKFLAYSPQFGTSHMTFIARISDALVDAGHEVVILVPILDSLVKAPSTKKARVITLPRIDECEPFEHIMNVVLIEKVWTYESAAELFIGLDGMMESWQARCNATVRYPGLIDQLKEEKFDVAFGESMDFCMYGLFHLLGIEKWAVTDSLAMKDDHFYYSQTPGNPAYVPGLMTGEGGESMSFMQRLTNFLVIEFSNLGKLATKSFIQPVFNELDTNFPDLEELAGRNSLVFVNSEPLVDFPRPSSARMIDIGGIIVSNAPKALNEEWSDVLEKRPKTVLISFGSFAKAHLMPAHYKKTLIETVRKFPNVTFIWKYEKPEHRVSEGVENLIETTWMPQNDILHDPRLSAFVTHCGQGSTTEANYAGKLCYSGVPLVVIPVAYDQLRNAEQMRRIGVGMVLDKKDLAIQERFEEAVREILENESYKTKAQKLRALLLDRPFTMKEIFVKNMEFLAKHGPLRQLDHYGKHLNFFQYYLIDVIGALIVVATVVLIITFVIAKSVVRLIVTRSRLVKEKDE